MQVKIVANITLARDRVIPEYDIIDRWHTPDLDLDSVLSDKGCAACDVADALFDQSHPDWR